MPIENLIIADYRRRHVDVVTQIQHQANDLHQATDCRPLNPRILIRMEEEGGEKRVERGERKEEEGRGRRKEGGRRRRDEGGGRERREGDLLGS